MAYNGGFPVTYPQFYPQYQQQAQPQQAVNNGMVWVQGEAGAKSYLVAPNITIPLWDSEAPVIYLKSADASGMPSMKVIDYQVREQAQMPKPIEDKKPDFATHDELKELEQKIAKQFEELKGELGA